MGLAGSAPPAARDFVFKESFTSYYRNGQDLCGSGRAFTSSGFILTGIRNKSEASKVNSFSSGPHMALCQTTLAHSFFSELSSNMQ